MMGRPQQENAGVKDFMGLGKETASRAEGRKHVYALSSHMRGCGESKQNIYMDKLQLQPMLYGIDPYLSSQHYADVPVAVKSNVLDAVQQPAASIGSWLYNNGLPDFGISALAPATMRRPDWNNHGGRQQFMSFDSLQKQREVEKVNLPANCVPDPSGSGRKVFPFVDPVLHEQASTLSVHQIPIPNYQGPTTPLLVDGSPSTRMHPADSSSTQLTIFYAGRVIVYNDVSSIKAQEIMLMAASGSSLPSKTVMLNGTSIHMVTPAVSGFLKSADFLPESSRMDPPICQPDQLARNQVSIRCPLPSSKPQEPLAKESCMLGTQSAHLDNEPFCPQALPQARKASLARFLEKRKARVLSKSPYTVEKSFFEEVALRAQHFLSPYHKCRMLSKSLYPEENSFL